MSLIATAPLALTSPLPLLRQWNGLACYNFARHGSEDLHNLSLNLLFEQTWLRPPVQLCQPFSHLNPVLFTSFAMFTVWTVDSQKGRQVASELHDQPRRVSARSPQGVLRLNWREMLFGEAGRIMPHDAGVVSIKLGYISMRGARKNHSCEV